MKDEIPPNDHDQCAYDHAWAEIIGRAQHDREYTILGRLYERIPFGNDLFGCATARPTCRDCGAARGELHVPTCCWEQCPRCGRQGISCDCEEAL